MEAASSSSSRDTAETAVDPCDLPDEVKYQTLFWTPMLKESASQAKNVLTDMLQLIDNFREENESGEANRRYSFERRPNIRRAQILGEYLDSDEVSQPQEFNMSDEIRDVIIHSLKSHYLLKRLTDTELCDLLDFMKERAFSEGETIITEGEPGDEFFVLISGEVTFYKIHEDTGLEVRLGEKSEGYFGDLALISNSPRAATVRASRSCQLWAMSRSHFRKGLAKAASKLSNDTVSFLSNIKLFKGLDHQNLISLARSLVKQSFHAGDTIIRQGDAGKHFYILQSGVLEVTQTLDDGTEKVVGEISEFGSVFGERALIRKEPRARNIKAKEAAEVLVLGISEFNEMLGTVVEKLNDDTEIKMLRELDIFKSTSCNDAKLKRCRSHFKKILMHRGFKFLLDRNTIFIVLSGIVETSAGVQFGGFGKDILVGNLVDGSGANGSLVCKSDEAIIVSVNRQLLADALNSVDAEEEPEEDAAELEAALSKRRSVARSSLYMRLKDIQLNDLEVVKPIGRGTFGAVYLAKHVDPTYVKGQIAIKCMDKSTVVSMQQEFCLMREITANRSFQHHFIAEFYGTCWSPRKIFLLMEHVDGIELWVYLYGNDDGKPLKYTPGPYGGIPVEYAALYIANVVLALEHVHSKDFVYRDLKPENLMIARNGYLKFIDFGLAKSIPYISKNGDTSYRTFTLCGTPEYVSPEMILTKGHDKSNDFWALGVLAYELMCGRTPFEGKTQSRTFEKITNSDTYLGFPKAFDAHAKSLIRRLLHSNSSLRLGNLQNGFDGIKEHVYFHAQGVNFDDVDTRVVAMPYIPHPGYEGMRSIDEIEPLNLSEEIHMVVENDYEDQFRDIILQERLGGLAGMNS